MGKQITVFLVDSCALDAASLATANQWIAKAVLLRFYWGRKTDQIALCSGNGTSQINQIVNPGAVTKATVQALEDIEATSGESTAADDILDARLFIDAHCKKLKYDKKIVFFGRTFDQLETVRDTLAADGIDLLALFPDPSDLDLRLGAQNLQEYCARYMPKIVDAAKRYDGVLSLGHPGSDNLLEIDVQVYSASRKSDTPRTTGVYIDSKGQPQEITVAREKIVDGDTPVDDSKLSKGYMYGAEIIPVPQQLDDTIRKSNNLADGAFEIIGFVKPVPQAFIGDSNFVRSIGYESYKALSALSRSLYFKEMVAVARFCEKRAGAAVSIVFLEPLLGFEDDDPDMLLMTAAPFNEDARKLTFTDLAKLAPEHIPTKEMIEQVDAIVDEMDLERHELDIDDFIVPNPRIDRYVQYMMDQFRGEQHPQIKAPVLPESLLKTKTDLSVLGLEKVVKVKAVKEEDDGLIAQEQELDLDELLG